MKQERKERLMLEEEEESRSRKVEYWREK
jgi:hypothetical protein